MDIRRYTEPLLYVLFRCRYILLALVMIAVSWDFYSDRKPCLDVIAALLCVVGIAIWEDKRNRIDVLIRRSVDCFFLLSALLGGVIWFYYSFTGRKYHASDLMLVATASLQDSAGFFTDRSVLFFLFVCFVIVLTGISGAIAVRRWVAECHPYKNSVLCNYFAGGIALGEFCWRAFRTRSVVCVVSSLCSAA